MSVHVYTIVVNSGSNGHNNSNSIARAEGEQNFDVHFARQDLP